VVGVEVRDEHVVEVHEADRADHLALGALSAIDEKPLSATPDERGGKAAAGGGRRAGRPEEYEVEVHGGAYLPAPGSYALDGSA
jgi:hypothetical protein